MIRTILLKAIDQLEDAKNRIRCFISEVSLEMAKSYLDGFRQGLRMADVEFSFDLRKEATQARGLEFSSGLNWELDMRRHGATEEKIVDEMFNVFIDELCLMLRDLPE